MTDDWNWGYAYYTVIYIGGWLGAVTFPILYAITARFWKTSMGRHFFAYSAVVAALYTSGIIKNYVPQFDSDIAVRYGLLTVAFFVVWWRVWEYVKILRAESAKRKEQLRLLDESGKVTNIQRDK